VADERADARGRLLVFARGRLQDDIVGSGVSMTAGRDLGRTLAVLSAALALVLIAAVAPAAAAPALSITQPQAGHALADPSPPFAGTSDDPLDTVTLEIYEGTSTHLVQSTETLTPLLGEAWQATLASPLADGAYTVVASQTNGLLEQGESEPVAFGIDTVAPIVSVAPLATPTADATPTLKGSLGQASGDLQAVTVAIFKGSTVGVTPAVSGSASVSDSTWSFVPSALPDGTYTAQAYQADAPGNKGASAPVTFLIDTLAPALTIVSPVNNSIIHFTRPSFNGSGGAASGDESTVTLKIYEGTVSTGTPSQTLVLAIAAGKWTTPPSGPRLANGLYTAVVEQADEAGNTATRATAFVVSSNSPTVTLVPSRLVQRGETSLLGPTPSFSGGAGSEPEDATSVKLDIYEGTSASGIPLRAIEAPVSGSSWASGPLPALPDGTYTAQAEQRNVSLQAGVSQTTTFTVDADAPLVTLTTPVNGSSTGSSSVPVGGAAGTADGDSSTVTVRLFAGTSVAAAPLETVTVAAVTRWSTTLGGLGPGTYTASAQQEDDVGNIGTSAPATFTVTGAPPPPGPPVASFQWFPSAPRVGEPVSLVSTSTDAASPITSFAWSLAASGAFSAGPPVLSTTFSTPGSHVVRLSVTDAAGRSSTVAETIAVAARAANMMQPFPVVRIAGSQRSRGVIISLFTVQAPTGSRVSVRCRGRGCPARSQSVIASVGAGKGKTGVVVIVFKRFERSLRVGAVLEIKVSRGGQIGKYVRFVVRRARLPSRDDKCLTPADLKPIDCPIS
jgi:large repetitive protein